MHQRDYGYPEGFLPWRAPAEKRGHIMMWAGELLRLTRKECTEVPMVRWTDPYRPVNTADVAPSTDCTALSEGMTA